MRDRRKEDKKEDKQQRQRKSVIRTAGRSFGEPPLTQPLHTTDLPLAPESLPFPGYAPAADVTQHSEQQFHELSLQPQTLSGADDRRARRAQQREQRVQSASASPLPAVSQPLPAAALPEAAKQPTRPRQRAEPLPGQPTAQSAGRARRRRGSTTAAAAPAPLQADSSVQELQQPHQQPATLNRGGLSGPLPAVAAVAEAAYAAEASATSTAPASLAVAVSAGSSSSVPSSSNSLAATRRQQATRGFQPLSLQQGGIAAPSRSPVSRRTARAAGIGRTKAVATAPAPSARPAAVEGAANLPKLVDNNMHGLVSQLVWLWARSVDCSWQ